MNEDIKFELNTINTYLKLIKECDEKIGTLYTLKLRLQEKVEAHQNILAKLQ